MNDKEFFDNLNDSNFRFNDDANNKTCDALMTPLTMNFNDDTPLGHGQFITDDEFKLLQIDEKIDADISTAKKINMKKLCRWFDKHNSDFIGIKVNKLNIAIDELILYRKNIFNHYFIDNMNIHKLAIETGLTIYKVQRELNKICRELTETEGILIKE